MSALLGRMGLAGCTSALLILSALEATAQPEARGKAAAEALFQEGKALFDQGKYEEACAKFAASQELDGGFGTLMNLGECFERRGMTASAWATFKEAAGLARNSNQTDRETAARDRATRLETSLSKVIVRAAPSVMETPGLTVRLNGTPLPRAVWGSAVPVDPGTQHLEVAAPGYRAWSATLNVPTGPGQTPVDLPPLVREQAEGPGSTTLPTTPTQSKPLTGKPPAADDGTTQRTLGYVLGGAGAVGLAVGSYFGLSAISKNKESDRDCRSERQCSSAGLELRNEARDLAAVSTVAFIAGGALAAGGLALYLTAPSGVETASGVAEERTQRALALHSRVSPSELRVFMEGSW